MTKFKKILATLTATVSVASALCVPISVSAANTTMVYESSNNNSRSNATPIDCDKLMHGTISSISDVDYFIFNPPATGYTEIQLGILSNANYDIELQDSTGYTLATSTYGGIGDGERIRHYVIQGGTYYIKVFPHSGSSYTVAYNLYVSYPYGLKDTWYPQVDAHAASDANNANFYDRWNTYNLDTLNTNPPTVYDKKFFMENGSTGDLMYQGCSLACMAMVLHNHNAVTTNKIRDFRTGYYGYAYADPFTVAMANVNLTSVNNTNGYLLTPSVQSWDGLAQAFGKRANPFETPTWNNAVSLLSTYPRGVIVKFYNSTYGPHFVVLTQASNSEGYLIYDPATKYSYSCGKTWSNSSVSQKYNISQVDAVISIS